MTDLTAPLSSRRAPLPEHATGLGGRIAAGAATPGGAIFVLVIVLAVATIIANPNFGDPGALIRFAGRTAAIAIAAMGQYYVIVSGEFDLSMGAVVTAQVVMAGNLIGQDEGRILPVMLLMVAVGVLIGVINGLVTTLLKVPSFIVTLGMMLALSGLVRYLTGGAATGNPVDSFRQIGRGGIEDVPVVEVIPYPLIILVVLAAAVGVADASPVRPHPDRRRRQPRGDPPQRRTPVVAQDPGLRAVVPRPPPSPASSWSGTPACTRRSARATSSPRSPPSSSAASCSAVVGAGCSRPRPAPSRSSSSSSCSPPSASRRRGGTPCRA